MVKKGFTLAEVLITLGIIGVVAALTLPSLVQNHKKNETAARLKKFYATMSQAIINAEIDNGEKAYMWDRLTWLSSDPGLSYDQTYAYWNKYLSPYIKTLKVEKGIHDQENNISKKTKVYFQDGSTVELNVGQCVSLYFDVNGDLRPNELGRDRFIFFIATYDSHNANRKQELYPNHSFDAAYLPVFYTKQLALNACKQNPVYCSAFLQYTNWEITDEYPYKI